MVAVAVVGDNGSDVSWCKGATNDGMAEFGNVAFDCKLGKHARDESAALASFALTIQTDDNIIIAWVIIVIANHFIVFYVINQNMLGA